MATQTIGTSTVRSGKGPEASASSANSGTPSESASSSARLSAGGTRRPPARWKRQSRTPAPVATAPPAAMIQNANGQLAAEVSSGSDHVRGANHIRSGMARAGASTAARESTGAFYFATQSSQGTQARTGGRPSLERELPW